MAAARGVYAKGGRTVACCHNTTLGAGVSPAAACRGGRLQARRSGRRRAPACGQTMKGCAHTPASPRDRDGTAQRGREQSSHTPRTCLACRWDALTWSSHTRRAHTRARPTRCRLPAGPRASWITQPTARNGPHAPLTHARPPAATRSQPAARGGGATARLCRLRQSTAYPRESFQPAIARARHPYSPPNPAHGACRPSR